MAIIQISKIQQRSGNLVDLPQLDEAQFGFAQDASRLFIGKTTGTPENIEVLTSYSEISFSQVQGSGNSNVNITANTLQPGQILGYDSVTGSWVNTGGNTANAGNANAYTGIPVHLGSVSNVKIGGGAIGYVLTTDGSGTLSWSPKTTVVANIIAISSASPAIMTFNPNNVSYVSGTAITILGVNGNANSEINGETLYVKVANNFGTTGNVSLYTDDTLANAFNGANLTYTNSPNATATSSFGVGGSSPAAGVDGSIQYNVSGVLTGSNLLKYVTANSALELSSSNIVVTNGNVSANLLTGTLTTASQPNITSVGSLASLSIVGNANIGNIGTAGLITATGNITGGNLVTGGIISATGNANVGNIGTTGVIATTVSATGNGTFGNIAGGNLVTSNNITITGISDLGSNANVRITGGNPYDVLLTVDGAGNLAWGTLTLDSEIANGLSNVYVNLDGNVTTSVGGVANVLTVTGTGANLNGTLSVSGNANAGNLGTGGLITATGNITGGNIISNGIITATGNVTAPNFIGNVVGNISGNLSVNGSNTQVIFNDAGLANANAGFTFNKSTGVVAVTGNITAGNISVTLLTGTVTTAAQPNITSTGTLTSASVSGNANIGNIGTGGLITATGNITGGNISGTLVTGTLTTAAQPNVTSVGTLAGLTVAGSIIPSANITYDLGNATNSFKDLYLSGNTIYLGGNSTITASPTGVVITTGNATPVTLKPAGANTQVQYNDDGAFGGQNTFTFNELTSTLTANNFIATSTANLGAVGNVTITGGSNGQVLTTNGSNVLSWTTVTGGNGSNYGDSNVVTLLASYGSNSISTTGNVTAKYLINSVGNPISAAGTVSGNATALANTINIVTTVDSGAGVKLPSATAGMTIYITNTSANSLIVYPAAGSINTGNASYTQPAGSTIHYLASSTTQWYTVGATYA